MPDRFLIEPLAAPAVACRRGVLAAALVVGQNLSELRSAWGSTPLLGYGLDVGRPGIGLWLVVLGAFISLFGVAWIWAQE